MAKRLNEITIIAGGKGTGKTTFTKRMMKSQKKPIIIIDTFDHPSYKDIRSISINDLKKWDKQDCRIFDAPPFEIIRAVRKYTANAFIVLEDARKYIRASVPVDIENFMIDSKQRNFDILVMYHSLGQVPKFMRDMFDNIVLMKTKDNESMINRYVCRDELISKFRKLKASKNQFDIEIIRE